MLTLDDFVLHNRRVIPKQKGEAMTKYGLGLDVGTGFVVSAFYDDNDKVGYKSIRDCFITINRKMFNPVLFNRQKVKYIDTGEEIYIVGDEALDFARQINSEAQRPLSSGIVNSQERSSANILEKIFQYVLKKNIKKKNETVVFSIPGPQIANADFDTDYHSSSIGYLLKTFDLNPEPLNEAYAVSLATLGLQDSATSLSFSFGAGLVNACLTYKGINIFEFSTSKSGDFVDNQASKACGSSTAVVSTIKEKELNLSTDISKMEIEEKALAFAYEAMIKNTVREVKNAFSKSQNVKVTEDIPIIISGGTSLVPGFVDMFTDEMLKFRLPFTISDVIVAPDQLKAVAEGCLIWANSLENMDEEE